MNVVRGKSVLDRTNLQAHKVLKEWVQKYQEDVKRLHEMKIPTGKIDLRRRVELNISVGDGKVTDAQLKEQILKLCQGFEIDVQVKPKEHSEGSVFDRTISVEFRCGESENGAVEMKTDLFYKDRHTCKTVRDPISSKQKVLCDLIKKPENPWITETTPDAAVILENCVDGKRQAKNMEKYISTYIDVDKEAVDAELKQKEENAKEDDPDAASLQTAENGKVDSTRNEDSVQAYLQKMHQTGSDYYSNQKGKGKKGKGKTNANETFEMKIGGKVLVPSRYEWGQFACEYWEDSKSVLLNQLKYKNMSSNEKANFIASKMSSSSGSESEAENANSTKKGKGKKGFHKDGTRRVFVQEKRNPAGGCMASIGYPGLKDALSLDKIVAKKEAREKRQREADAMDDECSESDSEDLDLLPDPCEVRAVYTREQVTKTADGLQDNTSVMQLTVFNASRSDNNFQNAKRILLATLMELVALPNDVKIIAKIKNLKSKLIDSIYIGGLGDNGMFLPTKSEYSHVGGGTASWQLTFDDIERVNRLKRAVAGVNLKGAGDENTNTTDTSENVFDQSIKKGTDKCVQIADDIVANSILRNDPFSGDAPAPSSSLIIPPAGNAANSTNSIKKKKPKKKKKVNKRMRGFVQSSSESGSEEDEHTNANSNFMSSSEHQQQATNQESSAARKLKKLENEYRGKEVAGLEMHCAAEKLKDCPEVAKAYRDLINDVGKTIDEGEREFPDEHDHFVSYSSSNIPKVPLHDQGYEVVVDLHNPLYFFDPRLYCHRDALTRTEDIDPVYECFFHLTGPKSVGTVFEPAIYFKKQKKKGDKPKKKKKNVETTEVSEFDLPRDKFGFNPVAEAAEYSSSNQPELAHTDFSALLRRCVLGSVYPKVFRNFNVLDPDSAFPSENNNNVENWAGTEKFPPADINCQPDNDDHILTIPAFHRFVSSARGRRICEETKKHY